MYREWIHCRLSIRVYCIHHVCRHFDSETMNECDWMDDNDFKQKICDLLKNDVKFISLTEAHRHLSSDFIRCKKYAVLTFDDGYASLKEIFPWLINQKIPVTLFVNPGYMDGKHFREKDTECYMSQDDIRSIVDASNGLITIGMHGWEHWDASQQSAEAFADSLRKSLDYLKEEKGFVPFWAYAWGRHSVFTDRRLHEKGIVPVYMDGAKNYNDSKCIHRELII